MNFRCHKGTVAEGVVPEGNYVNLTDGVTLLTYEIYLLSKFAHGQRTVEPARRIDVTRECTRGCVVDVIEIRFDRARNLLKTRNRNIHHGLFKRRKDGPNSEPINAQESAIYGDLNGDEFTGPDMRAFISDTSEDLDLFQKQLLGILSDTHFIKTVAPTVSKYEFFNDSNYAMVQYNKIELFINKHERANITLYWRNVECGALQLKYSRGNWWYPNP
jgi:hypothetical protein